MDYRWSRAQDELYAKTLEFARRELQAAARERDDAHRFSQREWSLCGEFGLLGLCVPESHGGLGLDALTTARVAEAFGHGCEDMGLVFSALAHLFAAVMPVAEHASEPLRHEVLPRLSSGAWVGANATTEGEAGSDAFALRTTATRDGDHYIIDGAKSYVTNGPIADLFVVYTTTNRAHGYLGITAFAVERTAPGVRVGERFGTMGLTTSPTSAVYFDACRVPASHRLGLEGQGGHIFQSSMLWERSCLFAAYVGMMQRQLEQTVEYARERRQSGRPIGKNQAISHRIVDMKLRLEAARLLVYRACWLRDQGEPAVADVSMAKLAVSEAARQSSLDAIQIHGGLGFSSEHSIERMLRDSVPSTLFSGTSEIQRDLIARELGL